MSISREDLIKRVVTKLAFVDSNGKKRVRIDDIAKITGLEKRIVETNILFGRISTLGEELDEENAEALIGERLLNYTHPEIEERLISEISQNISEAAVATTQPITVPESLIINPPLTPESIIKYFIIVDGSNVLYWMAANNLDDKVNLIPLLIALSAIKRKGFDFCCYFDAKQIFEIQEQQPEQFKELEKLRKKYKSKSFSVVSYADDFIVLDAKKTKRNVLSNDKFRDKETRLPRLPKSQLIDGAVANCQISIPKLDIIESLHSDLRKAVRDLETELNK